MSPYVTQVGLPIKRPMHCLLRDTGPKMLDLIEQFLSFKIHNRGRSPRTVQIYRLALVRLDEFLTESNLTYDRAGHDDLLLFTGLWLHRRGLKDPTSRRTHIAAVREFYKWATTRKLLPSNPALSIPYPKIGRRLPAVMSLAGAEKLMWAPDFSTFEGVRDGAILSVLIGCGPRVSGLVGLNESDLQPTTIEGRPRLVIKTLEKGNKERLLPVPEQAELLLRLYLEHPALAEIDRLLPDGDQVLFVSLRNRTVQPHEYRGEARRLRRGAVLAMVKKYGEQVGIPEEQLHPHAMRHLFGTELAESDVDLNMRQDLMGHADPKTTKIYTHLAIRKATREMDRANPLAKMRTPASDLLERLKGLAK